jgi:hypothetical protein
VEERTLLIVLTEADLAGLSETVRSEVIGNLASARLTNRSLPYAAPSVSAAYDGIEMHAVEDVTFKHVRRLMTGLSDGIHDGLRIMAQHGPVIRAQLLLDLQISPRHFQSGTTRRVRALTGDRQAFLLGWDRWSDVESGEGRFALSPITHQSLQRHFGLI